MAATALEVLPLDDLTQELRIADDASDHDALLTGIISAAVSFVSRFLRAPLVDRAETHRCNSPGADRPLALRADHVQSITPVRYWSAGTALREAPDGSIAVADLGRRVQVGKWFCVWPPADGWPEAETGSLFEVDLTRSITLTAQTLALKQAVILACRAFYDAEPMIKPTAAMFALIDPWRRMDADPPGTLVTVIDGAGATSETSLIPSTPVMTVHTNYLLASEDDSFQAAEVVASGTHNDLTIPAGTVPTGETRYFAFGRLRTLGAYRYVYLYPAGHRDAQSQIAGWDDGATLEISSVEQRLLQTKVAYSDVANGSVVEAG